MLIGSSIAMHGQLKVTINGTSITSGQKVPLEGLNSVKIGFVGPKKIEVGALGRTMVLVKLVDMDGKAVTDNYAFVVEGYSAVDDFLFRQPKEISLYEPGPKSDMKNYGHWGNRDLLKILEIYSGEMKCRQVTATVSLIYQDRVSYDRYGSEVQLLEPFTFYFDLLRAGKFFQFRDLAAEFSAEEAEKLGFYSLSFDPKYFNGNNKNITTKSANWLGFNSGKSDARFFMVSNLEVPEGKNQDEYLELLRADFETFVMYQSNKCNYKIQSKLPVPGPNDWANLYQGSSYGFGIFPQWDQKNNPAFASVKLFENVKIGELNGIRFRAVLKKDDCEVKPLEREDGKYYLLYFMKHPKNPMKIMMIYGPSWKNSEASLEQALDNEQKLIEDFLAFLHFN